MHATANRIEIPITSAELRDYGMRIEVEYEEFHACELLVYDLKNAQVHNYNKCPLHDVPFDRKVSQERSVDK